MSSATPASVASPAATQTPAPAARGSDPPKLSGGLPWLGHLLELRRRPIALMQRVRDECGEIGEFNLAGHRVVLLTGEEGNEAFFRASDEQLDQAAAYPFMKPIFGAGVVFDAPPEQRKQALRNRSLRDKFMRGHAQVIADETERMLAGWGEEGEIDLLDFFAELTIYTSSACLLGKEFREELTPEFATQYHELERGTDAIAYVNPYLPLPSFRKRDQARRRLVEMIVGIIEQRKAEGRKPNDLLQVLTSLYHDGGRPRYTPDEITGIFISMMFAGHHTTSGTAAWTLIELLRNPVYMDRVVAELEQIYADGVDVSYQALREIPELENVIKETLRLHPPLIIVLRKVMYDFHYKRWTVPAGKLVAASIAVSNRMPECFPDPERFDPERYRPGRQEDQRVFAWIPFGGGRHRCIGAAFAIMQLKAIFSILLRRYSFEMLQPSESYRNDHSKMVVQLVQPCRVRYRRRA
ncbi:MAG: cytochrome P450 [Deltaproteobacteria bacterium]|nr:MAG: cytochrome P450 [Deltaproteobacteria bacterium]